MMAKEDNEVDTAAAAAAAVVATTVGSARSSSGRGSGSSCCSPSSSSLTKDNRLLLLELLPLAVVQRILSEFCDGKSVSTLMFVLMTTTKKKKKTTTTKSAASVVDFRSKLLRTVVPTACRSKLLGIAALIEEASAARGREDERIQLAGAVRWIRSIAELDAEDFDDGAGDDENADADGLLLARRKMTLISENLAVSDFLQSSVSKYSSVSMAQFEWPVWVGRVRFDLSTGRTAPAAASSSASAIDPHPLLVHPVIVLTCPMQRPCYVPGSTLVRSEGSLKGGFICEHYNLVPVPPWGTIQPHYHHNIDSDSPSYDVASIGYAVQRLARFDGQVFVPAPVLRRIGGDFLDVRIVAKAQARQLQSNIGGWMKTRPPRTSWMLDDDDDDEIRDGARPSPQLICCWNDDTFAEIDNDREYVQYVLDMMKVMEGAS